MTYASLHYESVCGKLAERLRRFYGDLRRAAGECGLLTPRFANLHDHAYCQKSEREDVHSPIVRLMEQLGDGTHLDRDIVEAGSTGERLHPAGNKGVETQTVGAAK